MTSPYEKTCAMPGRKGEKRFDGGLSVLLHLLSVDGFWLPFRASWKRWWRVCCSGAKGGCGDKSMTCWAALLIMGLF